MTDSDDDYKLPSLAERIQAAFKTQSMVKSVKTYGSESEESEFLQFSERICNTPCSQVKLKFVDSSSGENEESEFLKFSERIRNTPCSQVKVKSGDLSHVSEKIHNTSSSDVKFKFKLNLSSSDSESEESEFLKFSEKVRNTPRHQHILKQKYEVSNSDSDSDGGFSNFITKLHENKTPKSQNNKHCYEAGGSDYDKEVSNFAKNIHGRQLSNVQKKKQQCGDSGSDSDGGFSNFITKIRQINTPKSQNKCNKEVSDNFLSSILRKQSLSNSPDFLEAKLTPTEDTSNSCMDPQVENKKEFYSLFPTRSDDSLFYKKRNFYTQNLFEFFNRKVFNHQLPKDMPLIWDESLMKTAGLTYCKMKQGVYSCSIKLSSKLLISFDRLQDTLLHEMCHAAVWMINKQNVGHGPLWQLWASRSKLILPFIDCPARCHTYDVPYRFWYQCTSCKWKRGTCRRIKRYQGAVCKRCNIPIILTVNKR